MRRKIGRWLFLLTMLLLMGGAVPVRAAVRQTGAAADKVDFMWDAFKHSDAGYEDLYYEVRWGSDKTQPDHSVQYPLSVSKANIDQLSSTARVYVAVNLVYTDNGEQRTKDLGSAYCYTTPGAVTSFGSCKFGDGQKSLEISWTDPKGDYLPFYEYEIRDADNKVIHEGTNATNALLIGSYEGKRCVARLRVRSCVSINNTIFRSGWSVYKNIVPQPVLKKASVGKEKVKLRWKKVRGASKYIIYMSKKKGSGYKKIASVSSKKTSYTVKKFKGKKLTKKRKYYYKIVTKTKNYGSSLKIAVGVFKAK